MTQKRKIYEIGCGPDERGRFPFPTTHDDLCWKVADLICIAHHLFEAVTILAARVETQQSRRKKMDKKMHQVTKRMKTAVKDVKKGKPKAAVKVLKKAVKKNEKLVKLDRTVRDPIIKKCKMEMKKAPMRKKAA